MAKDNNKKFDGLFEDSKILKPSAAFAKQANIGDRKIYERAFKDPERFWAEQAKNLVWFKPWKKVLEWKEPFAEWFVGGKLNVSFNCLDRFIGTPTQNKAAIIWEGEPGDSQTLTYRQLYTEVCKCANVLKKLVVKKGDRVILYMPMIPELPIAMLASARIGAVHSVVFGGFSAEALRDRINDAEAKILITADGGCRRGENVPLKHDADYALMGTPTVEKVVVVNRLGAPQRMKTGRDLWYHELMAGAHPY